MHWVAPTVSYLWPTRTELSRKVSEIGNSWANIFLWFVPEVAASRKFRSPHVFERKSFSHFPFLWFVPELRRDRNDFWGSIFWFSDFLIFWFFDFWSGCKDKAQEEESGPPQHMQNTLSSIFGRRPKQWERSSYPRFDHLRNDLVESRLGPGKNTVGGNCLASWCFLPAKRLFGHSWKQWQPPPPPIFETVATIPTSNLC